MGRDRACAYGNLAYVSFLHRAYEFNFPNEPPDVEGMIIADRLGLQVQTQWFIDRTIERPRTYSVPDHGVILRCESVWKPYRHGYR